MIDVEDHGGVAVLRLNHGKVNVLDLELLAAVPPALAEASGATAIVLTGAGRAFSAGVDLKRILDGGPDYVAAFLPALDAALLAVFDCPRPTVAAVNGHAIAGGCVLVAAADVRLMAAGTIGVTELLVGVAFPVAALEIMRHAVGAALQALALSGRLLDPQEARATGLIDEVVAPDQLLEVAVARARTLAEVPAMTYALTKEQLHRPARQLIERHGPLDDPRVTERWSSPEVQTAIRATLEAMGRPRTP